MARRSVIQKNGRGLADATIVSQYDDEYGAKWKERHLTVQYPVDFAASKLQIMIEIVADDENRSCGLVMDANEILAIRDRCNEFLGTPTDEEFEAFRKELAAKYEDEQ